MVHFNKDVGNVAARQRFLIRFMLRIDPSTRARLSKKFDVCYYPKNLELESRHEVGLAYRNDTSAQAFVHYIG